MGNQSLFFSLLLLGYASAFIPSSPALAKPSSAFSVEGLHPLLREKQSASATASSSSLSLSNKSNGDPAPSFSAESLPKLIGTFLLAAFALQAFLNLFTRELPEIFTGSPNSDYIGAVFDTLFLGWASQTLLLQTGVMADSFGDENDSTALSLDGLECRINLDIGREPGTWMDKEWAASGGRLVFPINVRFTNDVLDLGIPGEEGLGGRYCRRLEVLDNMVSFVGPQGQVEVPVQDGGWATLPILDQKMDAGERKLRFFLDFPEGAERNDVRIPKGRVFLSSACLPALAENGSSNSNALGSLSTIKAPSGASILSEGGLTIKSRGGILNLWGAAGDINLILGRYTVSER